MAVKYLSCLGALENAGAGEGVGNGTKGVSGPTAKTCRVSARSAEFTNLYFQVLLLLC